MNGNCSHYLSENVRAHACSTFNNLPILPYLDDIAETLHKSPSRALVLTAETAAGKSTAVPFALLDRFPGKVLMLEPRRLAVLAVAERTASAAASKTGDFIGYRMHLETKVSSQTRFEVLTEAVLLRMMETDPDLSGVSVVVIDEFHERSVYADTALAFLKDLLLLRDDLFVLVMSATIDTEKICTFLDCGVFHVPGRQFPVSIEYMPVSPEKAVCTALERGGTGSLLVFLPGIGDIRRTASALETSLASSRYGKTEVLLLHSSVPFEFQRRVFVTPADGVRRIILSSSVAETSLTVPDVTVVIDSGLARISRFEISCGMNRLVTENESVFSAVQRAGRAGRTQSGHCIRLWAEHDVRVSSLPPEIMRTDLVPLVLECACWGIRSIKQLSWLDSPPLSAWQSAVDFLTIADCLEPLEVQTPATENEGSLGAVTKRGKRIQSLGVHPRVGAVALGGGNNAENRANALSFAVKYSGASSPQEEKRLHSDLQRKLNAMHDINADADSPCALSGAATLVYGFFDRLAHHAGGGVYQFPSGKKAVLPQEDARAFNEASFPLWIVAPEADAGERTGRIYRWEPLGSVETIISWLDLHCTETTDIFFAETKSGESKVRKMKRRYYGKILLSEVAAEVLLEDLKYAYCSRLRSEGLSILPWNDDSRNFVLRFRFYARHQMHADSASPLCAWADESALQAELLNSLEDWLVPFLPENGSLSPQLFLDALRYKLSGSSVDKAVPLRLKLENGKEVPLIYEENDKSVGPLPVLEIIIQRIFGCFSTPTVCGVPVLLKLLSPARRPLQVTSDLAGFWQNTWSEICKEMKGRYPKHNWNYKDASLP